MNLQATCTNSDREGWFALGLSPCLARAMADAAGARRGAKRVRMDARETGGLEANDSGDARPPPKASRASRARAGSTEAPGASDLLEVRGQRSTIGSTTWVRRAPTPRPSGTALRLPHTTCFQRRRLAAPSLHTPLTVRSWPRRCATRWRSRPPSLSSSPLRPGPSVRSTSRSILIVAVLMCAARYLLLCECCRPSGGGVRWV